MEKISNLDGDKAHKLPEKRFKTFDEIGPRSASVAQVKWRQEVNDQDTIRYGMGMRYIK